MSTPSLQLVRGDVRLAARVSPSAFIPVVMERLLAAFLLIVLFPALLVVLLAVRLASRKSPLIAHRRVGRSGVEFWMLKIRTMWDRTHPPPPHAEGPGWIENLPETHVPASKGTGDPRVTSRLAAFCRRYSIDELPQLIHVLSGRMRLVGPRPVTRAEWNAYYGLPAADVLSVAPGMTGLWQVMGRNRLTYPQRRRLDLFYVRHCSPQLDLMLLLRTPARVLSGRDAS